MAEEDVFFFDNIECGVCAEYTDVSVYGRRNSGLNKEAFEMGERRLYLSWIYSEWYV